jgi:hypothetical protein
MSWWKSGDDLLGDGPADLFDEGLEEFVSKQGKPDWRTLLDSLDAALDLGRLRATFGGGAPEMKSDAANAAGPLADALRGIIHQIVEHYRERREREPTPSELVSTARFCLRARPERFIGSPGGVPVLEDLVLENPPPGPKAKA